MNSKLNDIAEYSAVYTVEEVQCILRISRSAAYSLANSGAFPVIHIGKSVRIPRDGFDAWFSQATAYAN